MLHRLTIRAITAAACAVVAQNAVAQDRVIIEEAPTTDEFVEMLFDAKPPAHIKMRGIQMHNAKPVASEPKIVAAPVNFAFNSTDIPVGFQSTLTNLAVAMRRPEASGSVLVVTGHTDPFGTDEYNLDLSQRRAYAVSAFLVDLGVSPDRIKAYGKGEEALISEDHAINRRVEFQAQAL